MKRRASLVLGVSAPAPRPTARGAFWLASVLSIPVFCVLALAELIWRSLG